MRKIGRLGFLNHTLFYLDVCSKTDGLRDLQALIGERLSFAARSEETKIPPAVQKPGRLQESTRTARTVGLAGSCSHTHTHTHPYRA